MHKKKLHVYVILAVKWPDLNTNDELYRRTTRTVAKVLPVSKEVKRIMEIDRAC